MLTRPWPRLESHLPDFYFSFFSPNTIPILLSYSLFHLKEEAHFMETGPPPTLMGGLRGVEIMSSPLLLIGGKVSRGDSIQLC